MKRNKIITIILSGALLVSLGGVGAKTIQNPKKATVKNNILLTKQVGEASGSACVVNGGSSLALMNKSGQVLSYLSVGQMLKVQQTEGTKSLVVVENTGENGYISNDNMLNIYNVSANDVIDMNQQGHIINVSSSVNFRKAPSMNAGIIKGLSNNTKVQVTGKVGQWYRVNVNGQVGFIFGEYISVVSSGENNSVANTNTQIKPSSVDKNEETQTTTKPNVNNTNKDTNTNQGNNSNIINSGTNNGQTSNNTGNNINNNSSNSNSNSNNSNNNSNGADTGSSSSQGNNNGQIKPDATVNKGWKTIDGKRYFFRDNGTKATGYVQIKADGTESEAAKDMETPMYYFNKDGVMQTGWVRYNYFNKDGVMQTGWQEINGKYYFWYPDGQPEFGEVKHNGNTYWLNEDGTMYKGFKDYYGMCYFNEDGIRVSGWQTIDNHRYYFNKNDGKMQIGWFNQDGKTYYFNSKGIMQTGKQTIQGKEYEFNNNGELISGNHNYKMAENLQEIINVKSGSMQGIINQKPVEVLLQNNIKIISSNEIQTKVIFKNTGDTKTIKIQDNSGQLVFYVYNSNGTLDTSFQSNKETYKDGDKTTIKYVYNSVLTYLSFELN